jgi:beta-glucosidase
MKVPVEGFSGGDRLTLDLPHVQHELMQRIAAVGKPTVLVLMNGSALSANWAVDHIPGIVEAWYPGEAGGDAIADVLFGDYNPAGRLPVTFYKSVDQLPPFTDYNMKGRTYRYFTGQPLFPFGYGLSYSKFEYSGLQVPNRVTAGDPVDISAEVQNTGAVAGEEVAQIYIKHVDVPNGPIRTLAGFKRVTLQPGQHQTIHFTLRPFELAVVDMQGKRMVQPGPVEISVGGKQPGFSGAADASTTTVVTGRLNVTGAAKNVD